MNAAVAAVANRTFAALRFRNYRLYLGSMVVSFSGSWMQSLAQSWLVLELTGSGTALGTVVTAGSPDDSLLYRRVAGTDTFEPRMPAL